MPDINQLNNDLAALEAELAKVDSEIEPYRDVAIYLRGDAADYFDFMVKRIKELKSQIKAKKKEIEQTGASAELETMQSTREGDFVSSFDLYRQQQLKEKAGNVVPSAFDELASQFTDTGTGGEELQNILSDPTHPYNQYATELAGILGVSDFTQSSEDGTQTTTPQSTTALNQQWAYIRDLLGPQGYIDLMRWYQTTDKSYLPENPQDIYTQYLNSPFSSMGSTGTKADMNLTETVGGYIDRNTGNFIPYSAAQQAQISREDQLAANQYAASLAMQQAGTARGAASDWYDYALQNRQLQEQARQAELDRILEYSGSPENFIKLAQAQYGGYANPDVPEWFSLLGGNIARAEELQSTGSKWGAEFLKRKTAQAKHDAAVAAAQEKFAKETGDYSMALGGYSSALSNYTPPTVSNGWSNVGNNWVGNSGITWSKDAAGNWSVYDPSAPNWANSISQSQAAAIPASWSAPVAPVAPVYQPPTLPTILQTPQAPAPDSWVSSVPLQGIGIQEWYSLTPDERLQAAALGKYQGRDVSQYGATPGAASGRVRFVRG